MTNLQQLHTCPACKASLAGVTAFVEAFGDQAALPPTLALRLQLVLEELLSNTIKHGHGGDSEAPVHIRLLADAAGVELHYEDRAPAFDPLAHLARNAGEHDAELTQRPVGHLGLLLLREMSRSLEHEALDGGNRLTLRFDR